MHRIIIICLVNMISLPSFAQSISQKVLSSGGSFLKNNYAQMSFTIGEPIILTAYNNISIATQGFHQPDVDIVNLCDDELLKFVSVYPNPASNVMHVVSRAQLPFVMYNNIGIKVFSGQLEQQSNYIPIHHLANGVYLLKISISCNTRTIKLVINNESY
jgi:hypothetical protein